MLGTVFHFLESAMIYFRSVLPSGAILPVVCEADESNDSNQMLKGMLELGEICMKRLPQYFPELEPLAEEWKKLGARGADNWAKAGSYRFGHKDTPHLGE